MRRSENRRSPGLRSSATGPATGSHTALEVNYAATGCMIEIAKGNGVERFVFASSCSVTGRAITCGEHSRSTDFVYANQGGFGKSTTEARTASFHPVVLRLATVSETGTAALRLVVNLLVPRRTTTARHIYTATVASVYSCRRRRGWHPANPEAPLGLVSGEIFNWAIPA